MIRVNSDSIIELQDFEGFWTAVTDLASIMGSKENVLSKMDKEKSTWDLVGCKARTWLEENRYQTEVLEAETRQVVQQGK